LWAPDTERDCGSRLILGTSQLTADEGLFYRRDSITFWSLLGVKEYAPEIL
jgi:hypothetical protein